MIRDSVSRFNFTRSAVAWAFRRANHRFKFYKRGQYLIGVYDKTLSVAAMRACNPDCSRIGINRRDAAPTPTGFAQIVGDDFPLLHPGPGNRTHGMSVGLNWGFEF